MTVATGPNNDDARWRRSLHSTSTHITTLFQDALVAQLALADIGGETDAATWHEHRRGRAGGPSYRPSTFAVAYYLANV